MESAYHGVPILGIPIFFDQEINMRGIQKYGYSNKLEIVGLKEEQLETIVREMLTNSSYAVRAKEVSALMKDQPQSPMERAVYWTEYVIRHKGAPHLRSAARNLSWWQYHSIDVLTFLGAIVFTVIAVIVWCIKKCVNFFSINTKSLSTNGVKNGVGYQRLKSE